MVAQGSEWGKEREGASALTWFVIQQKEGVAARQKIGESSRSCGRSEFGFFQYDLTDGRERCVNTKSTEGRGGGGGERDGARAAPPEPMETSAQREHKKRVREEAAREGKRGCGGNGKAHAPKHARWRGDEERRRGKGTRIQTERGEGTVERKKKRWGERKKAQGGKAATRGIEFSALLLPLAATLFRLPSFSRCS